MSQIAAQIDKVYKEADYAGSLVVEGETNRPTEYDGDKTEPPDWWFDFWKRYEKNTGQSREEAIDMIRKLRGPNWNPRNEEELARALREAKEKNQKP